MLKCNKRAKTFYDTFGDAMKTKEGIGSFLKYLLSVDCSDFNPLAEAEMDEDKIAMLEKQKPHHVTWAESVLITGMDARRAMGDERQPTYGRDGVYSNADLRGIYLREFPHEKVDSKKFSGEMIKIFGTPRTRIPGMGDARGHKLPLISEEEQKDLFTAIEERLEASKIADMILK